MILNKQKDEKWKQIKKNKFWSKLENALIKFKVLNGRFVYKYKIYNRSYLYSNKKVVFCC